MKIIISLLCLSFLSAPAAYADVGIAGSYPHDQGIESNSDVIFVERFDQASLTDLYERWGDHAGTTVSFNSEVPAGNLANSRSLSIGPTAGQLYKIISPGINDVMYVRYYVKYPTSGEYHHSGIWIGGYNPVSSWPDPKAGIKPVGNDRFIAAAEQVSGGNRFDHYNYWMNMHPDGNGEHWGNYLLNSPNVSAALGGWTCVEQMVKLNNPVSASNGEHAIWINGLKVSHLGAGFPRGSWGQAPASNPGIFTQNPNASTSFEGFRWRSDPNLNLNWIWLQNYTSGNTTLKFSNVVVAKKYIGCLANWLVGDINQDRIVNSLDYSILNSRWFTQDANADLNDDGLVNALDFSYLNINWLRTSN